MTANQISLGIDFRRNQLILCLLQKTWRRIRLLAYRVKSWEGEINGEELSSFIANFISSYPQAKDKIFISIPREKVVLRFLRLPWAARENLRQVLEYETPKYVPLERTEVYFDFKILHQDAQGIDLVAIFAKKKDVDFYLSLLEKIGLKAQAMQISSLGALNLFFYHTGENYKKDAILLELQGSFGEINFIKEGKWGENFYFPLPIENKEEKIKEICHLGGVTEDLLSQTPIYVFGLAEDDQFISSLQNHPSFPNISFPPRNRIKTGAQDSLPASLYGTAGLPLTGLGKTSFNLNLIPAETKKKVRQVGKFFFVIFLFLALFLTFSWIWGSYKKVQDELQFLRAEVNRKKPEVEAVEKLKKEREALLKEIAEFEKISSGEVKKIEILKELTLLLPPSVWLWNLKSTGQEVEISGFADSASDLLPLLDRSPFFEKVEFLAPVTKERERRLGGEKEKERFKIRMSLEKKRP